MQQQNGLRLTADPQGPFHGPLAHAFACGAHICVHSGSPWNARDRSCECCDPARKREVLRESWGIETTEDWRRQQEALLNGESSNQIASAVLGLRMRLVRQRRPFDLASWQTAIEWWCRQNQVAPESYQQLAEAARMIMAYENRFVADRLLPPGGFATRVEAWDLGRAANMARWGVQCGFTDPRTAHAYAVRASEQARRFHTSWVDFSVGYIVGRCLHFDEGEFGWRYTDVRDVQHTMMSDPQSPWLNIPWYM